MKFLKTIVDDILMITVFPELIYKVLFKPELLEEGNDKLSKYAQWVSNFVNKGDK